MVITASLINREEKHEIIVATNQTAKPLAIPGKTEARGSSVNGGELLFAAIATCFCNDTFREASRRKIIINKIEVTVTGEFGGEGEPARKITYSTKIDSPSPQHQIDDLVQHVDAVAEIHNTLRQGIAVTLV